MTAAEGNKDGEYKATCEMPEFDEVMVFPRTVHHKKTNEDYLPKINHITDNDDNRSDTKIECNYRSRNSGDIKNRALDDNSGALNQGNQTIGIFV